MGTKPSSSTRERTRTSQSRRRRRRRHVFSARGICRETALVARRRRVRGASDVRVEHDSNAVQIIFHVRCEILGGNAVRKRGKEHWQFFRSCVGCDRRRVLPPRQIKTTTTTTAKE